MAEIKAVRLFGSDLRVFDPTAEAGETVITLDTVSGEDPSLDVVAIEFSNGYVVEIGQDEGGPEEPIVVKLTFNGEPVAGGHMSWSEQFSFRIPL